MISDIIGVIEGNITFTNKTNKSLVLSNGHSYNAHSFHSKMQVVRALYLREVNKNPEVRAYNKLVADKTEEVNAVLDSKLKELMNTLAKVEKVEVPQVLQPEEERGYVASLEVYKKWYEESKKETRELSDRLTNIGSSLYTNLSTELRPILVDFREDKGTKFIIQSNYRTGEFRFCFDPYKFKNNYHSSLSELYREEGWGTINGGWMKVFYGIVVLYAKSGDYGVYSGTIAVPACKLIFPNREVFSHEGKEWEDINSIYDNDTLPF